MQLRIIENYFTYGKETTFQFDLMNKNKTRVEVIKHDSKLAKNAEFILWKVCKSTHGDSGKLLNMNLLPFDKVLKNDLEPILNVIKERYKKEKNEARINIFEHEERITAYVEIMNELQKRVDCIKNSE